jgi:hypothetical protein
MRCQPAHGIICDKNGERTYSVRTDTWRADGLADWGELTAEDVGYTLVLARYEGGAGRQTAQSRGE